MADPRTDLPLDRPEIWWVFRLHNTVAGHGMRRHWVAVSAIHWIDARDAIGGHPRRATDWLKGLSVSPRR